MRTFITAFIVALFLTLSANAAPVARAYVVMFCKSEDVALSIADADTKNSDAAGMLAGQNINAGKCVFDQRGAWALLSEKIYEYTGADGKPAGVWKLAGYEGWVIVWDDAVRHIGQDS